MAPAEAGGPDLTRPDVLVATGRRAQRPRGDWPMPARIAVEASSLYQLDAA